MSIQWFILYCFHLASPDIREIANFVIHIPNQRKQKAKRIAQISIDLLCENIIQPELQFEKILA